jgi:hypothetical protein
MMGEFQPATSEYIKQEDYLYLSRKCVILDDTLECEKVEQPKVDMEAKIEEVLENGWERYRVTEGGLVEVSERLKAIFETYSEDLD